MIDEDADGFCDVCGEYIFDDETGKILPGDFLCPCNENDLYDQDDDCFYPEDDPEG